MRKRTVRAWAAKDATGKINPDWTASSKEKLWQSVEIQPPYVWDMHKMKQPIEIVRVEIRKIAARKGK